MQTVPDFIDFSEYAKHPIDADRLLRLRTLENEIKTSFENKGLCGCSLPWTKTHQHVRLRESELTIWAGTNGSGKSMLLSHVIVKLLEQKQMCCIASLEMPPVTTSSRLTRQVAGTQKPTMEFIDKVIAWTDDNLWIYNQPDIVKAERMKGLIRYCREELGVQHFVIDSLMKCGIRVDDYSEQKSFVDWLATYARNTGLHVHLICHTRKLQDESQRPDKYDIKGTSEIVDLADNVFTLWRNKPKENAIQQGVIWKEGDLKGGQIYPDVVLKLDKCRHGEWEGGIGLFFDPKSLQYKGDERAPVVYYV